MRVAVTAEEDKGLESMVAQHFGRAPYFIFVDVEDGAVTSAQAIANPFLNGHMPGDIPAFIQQQNAQVMLSGGMGGRAIQFFEQMGIHAATGAQGTVRHSLERYVGGELRDAAPCAESVAHGHG